jgi:hypothetical protein
LKPGQYQHPTPHTANPIATALFTGSPRLVATNHSR